MSISLLLFWRDARRAGDGAQDLFRASPESIAKEIIPDVKAGFDLNLIADLVPLTVETDPFGNIEQMAEVCRLAKEDANQWQSGTAGASCISPAAAGQSGCIDRVKPVIAIGIGGKNEKIDPLVLPRFSAGPPPRRHRAARWQCS